MTTRSGSEITRSVSALSPCIVVRPASDLLDPSSQIVEKDPLVPNGPPQTSLVEIGPRFVMTPIRIFEGSFSGATVYENEGQSHSLSLLQLPSPSAHERAILLPSTLRVRDARCDPRIDEARAGRQVPPAQGGSVRARGKEGGQQARGERTGRLQGLCLMMSMFLIFWRMDELACRGDAAGCLASGTTALEMAALV